jgi:hypothetical protein
MELDIFLIGGLAVMGLLVWKGVKLVDELFYPPSDDDHHE